jgi:predicted phosphodiesterase
MRALESFVALGCVAVVAGACSSSSSGNNGGGGDDGGSSGPQAISFTPMGCPYTVIQPATLALTAFAPDDATAPADPTMNVPTRVRLGLGGGTTEGQADYPDPTKTAAFTWETAAASHSAKIQYGTDPSTLSQTAGGYTWTTPPPSVGFGTDEPPTYMHEVHVCGLTPGTTYYYQVGGGAAGAETWSATQSFTTVPTTYPINVGFLGDARDTVSTWQLVHERMRDAAVNLQVIPGDIVDIGADSSLWGQWFDAIWKDPNDSTKFLTLGQQMIIPAAGNHENEAARFYAAFAIPGSGDYAKSFTSFNVGSVHFVLMDDEQIGGATDPTTDPEAVAQLAWLQQDLMAANADRTNHPFIIAVNHRGLYSTSMHSTDSDVLQARVELAPLYEGNGVDLVVNGHDHEFERTKPLMSASDPTQPPTVVATGGTVYAILAGAGADPYDVGMDPVAYRAVNAQYGPGTMYLGCYGLLKIEATQITLTSYGLKASAPDDVLDTLMLQH